MTSSRLSPQEKMKLIDVLIIILWQPITAIWYQNSTTLPKRDYGDLNLWWQSHPGTGPANTQISNFFFFFFFFFCKSLNLTTLNLYTCHISIWQLIFSAGKNNWHVTFIERQSYLILSLCTSVTAWQLTQSLGLDPFKWTPADTKLRTEQYPHQDFTSTYFFKIHHMT